MEEVSLGHGWATYFSASLWFLIKNKTKTKDKQKMGTKEVLIPAKLFLLH